MYYSCHKSVEVEVKSEFKFKIVGQNQIPIRWRFEVASMLFNSKNKILSRRFGRYSFFYIWGCYLTLKTKYFPEDLEDTPFFWNFWNFQKNVSWKKGLLFLKNYLRWFRFRCLQNTIFPHRQNHQQNCFHLFLLFQT